MCSFKGKSLSSAFLLVKHMDQLETERDSSGLRAHFILQLKFLNFYPFTMCTRMGKRGCNGQCAKHCWLSSSFLNKAFILDNFAQSRAEDVRIHLEVIQIQKKSLTQTSANRRFLRSHQIWAEVHLKVNVTSTILKQYNFKKISSYIWLIE